jgi:hypothetical protein
MELTRRGFLAASILVAGTAALPACSSSTGQPTRSWPDETVWQGLRDKVGGRLIKPVSPLAACQTDSAGAACQTALGQMQNPFYLQTKAGATQTQGWYQAWDTSVSPYAVAATSADDVAAAVNFADENNVRLAVKGAGHDYLGRNTAPDSLLIWTQNMDEIKVHDDFLIEGGSGKGTFAISVGAGVRWLNTYHAATEAGLYVQGGGCTTVGASGGFMQGSGFGSLSRMYGTGAGNVLEFEVVTADGKIQIANEKQNSDLFWALRGGGGGTFGVVTRTTMLAHPIPDTMGLVAGKIVAKNDAAFQALLVQLVKFLQGTTTVDWGEQIRVSEDNEIEFAPLTYLNKSENWARKQLKPLTNWVEKTDGVTSDLSFSVFPFSDLWNTEFWDKENPDQITRDPTPGSPDWYYWWTSNSKELSWYLIAYQSRWLPFEMLEDPDQLAKLMFDVSRVNDYSIHLNKGLYGQSDESRSRDEKTCINPAVFDATGLIIMSSSVKEFWPELPETQADDSAFAAQRDSVNSAMGLFRAAIPDAGSYANEADFFETDWKNEFWGQNYDRLLQIKQEVDPNNLFKVHHGVGSDI